VLSSFSAKKGFTDEQVLYQMISCFSAKQKALNYLFLQRNSVRGARQTIS